MRNSIWKHRIVLGLFVILLIQAPFIAFKLTTGHRDSLDAFVEVAHILLTSGLVGYLFSKTFESLLEKRLYGGLRRNWKEVRVMYSDGIGKGMGDAYPREPTLLLQPPIGEVAGESARHTDSDSLVVQSSDGKSHLITAPTVHGPISMNFNTGYVGESVADENTVTGKWSELQLMQVGLPRLRRTRVGFPDTLVTSGRARS